jgi:hypothetical protein
LNAWVGGFQTILERMGVGNFNWFWHTMLFVHTEWIIERQKVKVTKKEGMDLDDDKSDEDDGDNVY